MNDKLEHKKNLRQKAEDIWGEKINPLLVDPTISDLQKLIHELGVHQIELEMQNEELVLAKEEVETARKQAVDIKEKYIELYDFAPTGYFTLSKEDSILDINFSAARMVDKERSLLTHRKFGQFVSYDTKPIYYRFLDNLFGSKINETCEVTLELEGKLTVFVRLTGIAIENREQCLVNIVDITKSLAAKKDLERTSAQLALATLAGGVGLWDYDIEKNVLVWDNQMLDLYGVDKKNFVGAYETWWSGLHPDDRIRSDAEFKMALCGKKDYDIEFRVIWPDKTIRHIRARAIVQRDGSGKAMRMIGTNWDITERKLTENALRFFEAKHSSMIANISDVIGIMGADGRMKYKSPNMEKWFGWQPQDLIGTDGWLTVHPDDLQRIQTEFFDLLEKDLSVTTVEYRYKCKDGSYKPIELTATNLVSDPVINGVLLNYHDISKRKLSEGLLAQTRQNYETFFNTIDDFLFILDVKGNILHTNATVIKRLGYTREELLGESILMIHPPGRREEAGRITGEMLAGLTNFCPVPIVTKSGVQIPVETRVSHGIWDGKPALFGVTKDISKIALSEEKFSKIFHINPSACGLTDLDDNTYIEVNEAFHKLLGFTSEEAIGKTATDLGILSNEARHEAFLNADDNGNVANVEAILKAKNGDIKHVLMSSEIIFVQDKKYRFIVVQDITRRKMAETYRGIQQEILNIQTGRGIMLDSLQSVTDILITNIGFDAVGIRFQEGDDFPYLVQNGFSPDFLITENSLRTRSTDGGLCRAKDGSINLECTCGLVISGRTDPSDPLFTANGSIWTNDSSVFLDFLPNDDPRFHPRNLCVHEGYASIALVPIRNNDRNVGLIQFCDKGVGRFTVEIIEQLEGIAIHIGEFLMRKQAEDELQKSNTMLSLFMDHSPIFSFIKEVSPSESHVLKASENFKEMIGIPGSQMVGKSMIELFPPELAAKMTHDDWVVASEGKILEVEESFNGRLYSSMKYPINLGGKNLLAGFSIDITEKTVLEKKLIESERQYRTVIETAQEGILIAKGAEFVFVNQQMALLTGYSVEELMSRPFMEFVYIDDRELVKSNSLKRLNSETVEPRYHFRIVKKDGSLIWIEISGNKTEWKGEPAVINFGTDITDRINAETALRESEEKQRLASLYARSLIEASLDPLVTIDANGKITDVNTATESATGLTRMDLIGTDFSAYFTEQDKAKIVYEKVFEQGKVVDYPITIRHSSNKLIDVLYNASVYHNEDGKILGVFASARDVTERKRIEEEIKLKNDQLNLLNAQKDKLFSIIAHDLRSPFQTLLGFSPDKPEELMTYPLEKIQGLAFDMRVSANKLFSLLENLLEWSKMQQGLIGFKPRTIAISEVVFGIVGLIRDTADKKLIGINCDIPEDLTVMADVQMFESVVRNLVFNAIKFTKREGQIIISANAMPNNSVEISIHDTGIGMKKEMIDSLFRLDANVSRKGTEGEASTGLGLIICNDFIEKHGGKLSVESTVGKGSTFRFTLPGEEKVAL